MCVPFLLTINKGDHMIEEEIVKKIIEEAKKSLLTDDVPVGAAIIEDGKIIATAHNTREKECKITGHAEINAVEKACQKKNTWHLENCEIYTTLEPCKMCLEVIKQAKIKTVKYLSKQEKHITPPDIELIKIQSVENSGILLKDFFKNKRK